MIIFATEKRHRNEPDILKTHKHQNLLITSPEGQRLALFIAPEKGWTHQSLCDLNANFPPQWEFCGAQAYLGEQWIGSNQLTEKEEVSL
jgi:hypothetical protein